MSRKWTWTALGTISPTQEATCSQADSWRTLQIHTALGKIHHTRGAQDTRSNWSRWAEEIFKARATEVSKMNQRQSIFVRMCWSQKLAVLIQHVRIAGMLLVKISLYWLLPLNHAFERLNSLEGIIYQKKITSEKNIKRKDSAFTQRSCTQPYRTHMLM